MSAVIVYDCPRCNATSMTFDVLSAVFLYYRHKWQTHYELFCVCRNCSRPTIIAVNLSLSGREFDTVTSEKFQRHVHTLVQHEGSLNPFFEIKGHISKKDMSKIEPPEHIPESLRNIFNEASTCYSVDCHNAAAAMFRLCLDIATKQLVTTNIDNAEIAPTRNQQHRLADRLDWLFDGGHLSSDLAPLAKSIREHGNDGAHDGTLQKIDAEDLLDFTTILFERIYTEPAKLALADSRRQSRRS